MENPENDACTRICEKCGIRHDGECNVSFSQKIDVNGNYCMFCGAPFRAEDGYTCKSCGSTDERMKKEIRLAVTDLDDDFNIYTYPVDTELRTHQNSPIPKQYRNVKTVSLLKLISVSFLIVSVVWVSCIVGYPSPIGPVNVEMFGVKVVDGDTGDDLDKEFFWSCLYKCSSLDPDDLISGLNVHVIENYWLDHLTAPDVDEPGWYFITRVNGTIPVDETGNFDLYYYERWFVIDPNRENILVMYKKPTSIAMHVLNSSLEPIQFNDSTAMHDNITIILSVENGAYAGCYNPFDDAYVSIQFRLTFFNLTHPSEFVINGTGNRHAIGDVVEYDIGYLGSGITMFSGYFTSEIPRLHSIQMLYGNEVLVT